MARFKRARDINTAIIGYGGAFAMGKHHLRDMKNAGMRPTAVAEIDEERLKVAEADFPGIETYTSVDAMLENSNVNLITVITPHNTHAALALKCLRAGKHVVCEKPMAITTAECDRMIEAARKHKVIVSAYHNRHWDGCIMHAVKMIRRGLIGDVYRVDAHDGGHEKPGDWWRSSKSISGGVLYDWGVHFLEYALQIIDADIVEVTGFHHRGFWAAKSVWKQDTNEDEADAMVRFKNGAWLRLTMSSIDANPVPLWLEIKGTKGSYAFDGNTWQTTTVVKGQTVRREGKNPPDQWHRYYRNLADHLVRDKPLVITPQWSRRLIHILDLAGRSAARGAALKAKYK